MMETKGKTPGDLIAEEIEEKGWSQNQLARESGLKPSTINGIIKNGADPQVSTIKSIANALSVGPEEIMKFFLDTIRLNVYGVVRIKIVTNRYYENVEVGRTKILNSGI